MSKFFNVLKKIFRIARPVIKPVLAEITRKPDQAGQDKPALVPQPVLEPTPPPAPASVPASAPEPAPKPRKRAAGNRPKSHQANHLGDAVQTAKEV